MPKRTLEEVERLLGRLSPEEPSALVDSRILSRASGHGRQTTWRLAAITVLSGVAAVVCFGVFVLTRPTAPSRPSAGPVATPPAIEAIQEEVVLRVIATFRDDLDEISEMLEIVPDSREEERRRITVKLNDCLQRLGRLEDRVRLKPGSSYQGNAVTKEVHV